MSDSSERFLERLTQSFLPNHELAAHGRSEVEARLKPDQDKALEAAVQRLEAVDAAKWKPGWTKWAMLGVVFIVLAVLGLAGLRVGFLRGQLLGSREPTEDIGRLMARHVKYLSETERLLLFGDVSKTSPSDRIKALWDSEPANPAFFEDYGIAYLNDHNKLPSDFLETAEKLDPDNGWFHLLAAAVLSKDAVKMESQTKLEKEQRQAPRWKILDQSKMGEALSLMDKGCSKPRSSSYATELLKRRVALLPEPNDVDSFVLKGCYLGGQTFSSWRLRDLCLVVSAKASSVAATRDAKSFQTLLRNWTIVVRLGLLSDSNNVVEPMISRILISQPNPNFLQAAKDLGLTEETRVLDELEQKLKAEELERKARRSRQNDELVERRGGILQYLAFGMLGMQVSNSPVLTLEDITPNRRSDHALLAYELSSAMAGMLLLLLALLAAYPFRHGKMRRTLSRRLFSLMDRSDWAVLLLYGVALPFLYLGLIRYFTPLGGLDWSLKATAFLLPIAQFLLLLLLVVSTSVLVAQVRLNRRLGFLHGLDTRSKVGRVVTGMGYMALPLLGFSTSKTLFKPVLVAGGIIIGLIVIWLLALVIRGLIGSAHHALERQIVSRVLVPVMTFAAVLNCMMMPLFHLEESYWVKKDAIIKTDPSKPGMTTFETQITELMKTELLEMISPLESLER